MAKLNDIIPNVPGTYMIHDKVTDKTYIGASRDINKRRYSHVSSLKNRTHYNEQLQEVYNNNNDLDIYFTETETRDDAFALEQILLDEFFNKNVLLNAIPTSFPILSDYSQREDIKEQIRKRMLGNTYGLGRIKSDEERKKISEANTGNQFCLGRILSEETKEKIRQYNIANPPMSMLGKHHSDESKQKMSDACKGKTFSEDHKQKLSNKKAFPVLINGQTFNNAHVAANELGVTPRIVHIRTASDNFPEWKKLY